MDMALYLRKSPALTSKSTETLEESSTTSVNRPYGSSRILRSVERVGHFRRAYEFNPTAGVSETKTLEQHVHDLILSRDFNQK